MLIIRTNAHRSLAKKQEHVYSLADILYEHLVPFALATVVVLVVAACMIVVVLVSGQVHWSYLLENRGMLTTYAFTAFKILAAIIGLYVSYRSISRLAKSRKS